MSVTESADDRTCRMVLEVVSELKRRWESMPASGRREPTSLTYTPEMAPWVELHSAKRRV